MSEARAAIYRSGEIFDHLSRQDSLPRHDAASYVWIEVMNPDERDFDVLQNRFSLHCLAVKDAMCATQAPKLDVYDDQIFVVLKTARLLNDEIKYNGVDAFVSLTHIITVRHGDDAQEISGGHAIGNGARAPRPGPDFILYSIMNSVVNDYLPVVQMVEEQVLGMEQRLLDSYLTRNDVTRLFQLRREAIRLQHVLTRMSDVCGKLANLDVPCIGGDAKPYFRDVHDQLVRLDGMIRGLLDVIRAAFEASNLLEQQRQGVSTRKLAGWAAILGVPAAMAGIYEMNPPNIPGLHSLYGYCVVIGVMLTTSLALYVRLRRMQWL